MPDTMPLPQPLPNLTDRIVVINGATGTLGSAMAHALQRCGVQLVLFGRKSDVLNRLADELAATSSPHATSKPPLIQPVDFSGAKVEDYQTLSDALSDSFGHIDILIHAMGQGGQLSPLAHTDLLKFQESLHVNFTAPFALSRALWPLLEAAGETGVNKGQMLFFTDRGTPAFGNAYAPAHAALARLVEQWANETDTVRINALDPGPTHSGLRQYRFPGESVSERAAAEDMLPAAFSLLTDEHAHGRIVRLQPDRY
jgi:NAD(P)-dependent dehydrogenase (short-subunit alcohol dehydrogenase family)